jgi:DNA polymerase III, delta subunit
VKGIVVRNDRMKNNLYLIVGEDQELINFYLNKIMKEIGLDEEKKINYDMNTSSISDILDEVSMISLFSSEKVVIGYNFDIGKINDNDRDYLIRYLNNNNNNDRYIILIVGKVDGRSKDYKIFKDKFKIIDLLQVDNGKDIYKYVEDYIKDRGYKIDKYNLDYLVELLGNDINNINNEIDKILLYLNDDKVISREVIDKLVSDNIDNIMYEFTNAVLDRDYEKIGKMYNDFKIENVGYDYLIGSLGNALRGALVIKILYNQGNSNSEIAKFIGKKEFYVKKMIERLYNYTVDDLCMMIDKLGIIDREYKSGKSNIDMLELYLLGK